MSAPSVVFQVFSETEGFGVDFAIAAAAVVRVLNQMDVSAVVVNEGAEGTIWAASYGVPEGTDDDVASCEVLIRAWPAGQWPIRPNGPRTVVDFVRRADDRSREADFVVAFEKDGSDFPGLLDWNVLFPLPIEVNDVEKEIMPDVVVIHLGQDPADRVVGIRSAIDGFASMSALGLRHPGSGDESAGVVVTSSPWNYMASGDVAIVTPEFPYRLAAALRIPAVLVASNAEEGVRCEELVTRGHSSFLYLGVLSGLTNNQVRDAARDFRNDDTAKRVARLGGSEQRADQGIKRVADWIARELVGKGLHQDPYQVKGFDTVLDTFTTVALNAEDAARLEGRVPGGEEVPAQIDVFTIDGTWTKPDGARVVYIRLIGAGGGGGSGRRGAAGTSRGGGGGGAGGAANELTILAQSLPSTVPVVVGIGGIGAVGAAADNTSGTAGSNGTDSTFGDFIQGRRGDGGGGGALGAGGAGGVPVTLLFESHLGPVSGTDGSGGGGGTGGVAGAGGTNGAKASASGGGGGGGITAGDVGEDGGPGGILGSPQRAVPFVGGTAGTAGTPDGGNGESAETFNVQGGGGAGGGSSNGATPGIGGAGGAPGGGGGGGGAVVNGTTSGAGGDGASGLVIVTTFF